MKPSPPGLPTSRSDEPCFVFDDDMIRRGDLPRDVMGLIHDLCYHVESRGVEGYVKRAQRILSVDGCGSDAPRVSSKDSPLAASLSEPKPPKDSGITDAPADNAQAVLRKTLSRLLVKATYPYCLCGANTACDEPHSDGCEVWEAVNKVVAPSVVEGVEEKEDLEGKET